VRRDIAVINRAVLLAAGSGERMGPKTEVRPKCLLKVGGRSIVGRAVAILAGYGIRSITVVDGFEGDRLRSALTSQFPPEWFEFVRNSDYATTNNAWSLSLARRAEPESILLLDADVVFDREVIGLLLDDSHGNRLAVRSRGPVGEEEVKVTLGTDGRISDIGKHIAAERAAGESVGIAVFAPTFVRRLFSVLDRRLQQKGGANEWYESAFVELIEGGEAIYPVDLKNFRAVEIDTPADLEQARGLFAPKI
jgi:choline kinase